jgi:DNA-binding NarL/FixJ family response regulator
LLEETGRLQPDLLLLDANMPGPSVIETVKELKNHYPDVQVLVLTASKSSEQVLSLIKAGVSGYVLKEDSPRELLQAIETVAGGKEWISPRIAKVLVSSIRLQEQKEQVDLTEREKDVLRLMVTGISNDEIADQLFIATNTVKNHVRSIFRKLGVSTRVEAVVSALDNHLVDPIK